MTTHYIAVPREEFNRRFNVSEDKCRYMDRWSELGRIGITSFGDPVTKSLTIPCRDDGGMFPVVRTALAEMGDRISVTVDIGESK